MESVRWEGDGKVNFFFHYLVEPGHLFAREGWGEIDRLLKSSNCASTQVWDDIFHYYRPREPTILFLPVILSDFASQVLLQNLLVLEETFRAVLPDEVSKLSIGEIGHFLDGEDRNLLHSLGLVLEVVNLEHVQEERDLPEFGETYFT